MISKLTITSVAFLFASQVFSQAHVVDPQPQPGMAAKPQKMPEEVAPSPQSQSEIYYQLQLLQQEVLQLRGMVEEQAHELKRLKQQRLDDYLDLDRRLSKVGQGDFTGTKTTLTDIRSTAESAAAASAGAPEQELQEYKDAIDLVLRKQDYKNAVIALKQHLDNYPKGRYAANAQYWLGELYLKDNELEQSRQWFSRLLGEFPNHTKVPDAKYKLGRVYDMMGDKATAKKMLQEVVASKTSASNLARDYLDTHFTE
ncbi:tol-pal system protein YbgF [Saccharophagus degradans]|uniref:Cell division coordinator CpoB n=1 Tax=Saccharophagus degradans (strain 2-40 / ATCC 43961 / DSM 17024) TaxID=203122 RepID=Q21HP2_SACD2|nr:tol-pal system protein YbgF [Saccharophagus degradans]ABD81787.1 Tetratricopeptide TPR_2 [Saccharophagus degradans 2-40]